MSEYPRRRRPVSDVKQPAAPIQENDAALKAEHLRYEDDAPCTVGISGDRQPYGRTEELLRREYGRAPERRFVDDSRRQNRAPQDTASYVPLKKPHKRRHTLGWACLFLFCLIVTGSVLLFMLPMVTGLTYRTMPTVAFMNGSIIRMDEAEYSAYKEARQLLAADTIREGVTIDGIDVGGMTTQQAANAVDAAAVGSGHDFFITITVGDAMWTIDSAQIPMARDTEAVVERAYAIGRQNTASIRSTGITPFRERLNDVRGVASGSTALETSLTYDFSAIRATAQAVSDYVTAAPVNASVASFDFNTKEFSFNSDVSGKYLSADEVYSAVMAKLDSGVWQAALVFEPAEVLADVTKSDLMSSFRMISTYTTKTTSNSNRNTNIDLSARAITGTTVLPGETFSFNAATGERTAAKGYKPAAAISGGQSKDEIGGGVCQTSSTLFNAAVRADMTIIERSPHAWPSSYVERGFDATVDWPNLDFKFRNDGEWPIFIVAEYHSREVTCEIYGMALANGVTIDLESKLVRVVDPPEETKYVQNASLPAGTKKTTVKARTGYVVETYKLWYRGGTLVQREKLFTSTYKAYQETIEYN